MASIKTSDKKNDPEAKIMLEKLSEEGKLDLTFSKIDEFTSGEKKISEGDSQSISLMLFLELRKNESSKNWFWVRGIKKINENESVFHSWLEYQGYVVDPLPFYEISNIKYLPGDILVAKKEQYRKVSGFKPMSLKNEKQVLRWIEKINTRYS
ncbi:MAG: hypothetical protein H6681_03075 [Desulfobacteraceae bacterium]|nr:hypothetical protein [Desulfobacteraceae bacterium]